MGREYAYRKEVQDTIIAKQAIRQGILVARWGGVQYTVSMTTQAASAWDSKSATEKVEWLAKFIGWTVVEQDYEWSSFAIVREPSGYVHTTWNPIIDWNHWRQVEEKVMEEGKLYARFIALLIEEWDGSYVSIRDVKKILKADLPTRSRALYIAYQSLQ